MEINKEILEAIVKCQDLALKAAGNQIFIEATILHNFINEAIQEMNGNQKLNNEKEDEGGELDGNNQE